MHELSICRSMIDIVLRHADGRPVQTVHVRVGQLRQIVPDTLTYCWGLVSESTALSGSTLAVESIPAQVDCRDCGASSTLEHPVFRCPQCDSTAVGLTAGEEFLITSLDLAEA